MAGQFAQTPRNPGRAQKIYPKPSEEVIAKASEIIEEQKTHKDLPERKTLWAQEQLDQKQKHDDAVAQRLPDGVKVWTETHDTIAWTSLGSSLVALIAEKIVRSNTQRVLTRRQLFRREVAERSSQAESISQ